MPRKQKLPPLADVLALFEHDDACATVPDLAVYLRTTMAAIDHMSHKKTGPPSSKPGKHLLFRVGDVKKWLANKADARQEPAA
jgi:hypothetical protein